MPEVESRWKFWMDTGGTFTDCLARSPDGVWRRLKVLSSSAVRCRVIRVVRAGVVVLDGLPEVRDGFFNGYQARTVGGDGVGRVERFVAGTGEVSLSGGGLRRDDLLDLTAGEEAPVLAVRILTGCRLDEPLPRIELDLATTRGTNALLEGKGARVAFFVTAGFADLLRIGDQRRPDLFALEVRKPAPLHGPVVEVVERLAADGTVLRELDLEDLCAKAADILEAGIDVAAVALLHSYRNPEHEQKVARTLREMGFRFVSASSELAPLIKILPRAETAVVDAVLTPVMERYLSGVGKVVSSDRFFVMTSAGGLVHRDAYRPKDSLLSGPAGGVTGAAAIARRAGLPRVITFDMGGTSTDVARVDGAFDYRYQHKVGAARVFAPSLHVESVAAGGGSICRFDGTALTVGPESAGADPGPACYGAGGPLTLTDVNLLVGRLDPGLFGLPVYPDAAEARLVEVIEAVRAATGERPDRSRVLHGLTEIADERMADAIRKISVREGYDPAGYAMLAFGGAGGLHVCAVAEKLGVRRILFPADSGLLSAFGLWAAVPQRFAERQVLVPWSEAGPRLAGWIEELAARARAELVHDGIVAEQTRMTRAELELRFTGQESGLRVSAMPVDDVVERFREAFAKRFGYVPGNREIEVVALRVVVSATAAADEEEVFQARGEGEDRSETAVRAIGREHLRGGDTIVPNVLIQDRFSTLYVAPGWRGVVGSRGTLLIERQAQASPAETAVREDVVELELFTCRFLGLVEDMGMLLQRCALSVNIRERLDFSCALLDAEGELVANAPHIPVHLGALGACVREVCKVLDLRAGDVAITNHPAYGGSHLPDVTLIAPVHADDGRLLGYVANRAHHAEMGGSRPGSMPPDATCLEQEGVVLAPTLLVAAGNVNWGAIRERLSGGRFPSRAPEENLADLHAQLASIRCGREALVDLDQAAGAGVVSRYMKSLKARSADALTRAWSGLGTQEHKASDSLDDGTKISVTFRREGGRSIVDFEGTAEVHPGNFNATPAIVRGAVIYVLRILAGRELPLNEGLMRDVELRVPPGLLAPRFAEDPRDCPAVVGGNVETSQRVVDVLFEALGLSACSQGTMNNLIFGNARFSFYETIGGGSGAGPGFDGCDAVHCHMTNTAITDAEVFELRMPVRLERFAIRRGSGGHGAFRGGDGMVREIRFLEAVSLSLLTQRRAAGPPGAAGGFPGRPGRQWIERASGERQDLDGVAGAELEAGDLLVVMTPGGGGCGSPESRG